MRALLSIFLLLGLSISHWVEGIDDGFSQSTVSESLVSLPVYGCGFSVCLKIRVFWVHHQSGFVLSLTTSCGSTEKGPHKQAFGGKAFPLCTKIPLKQHLKLHFQFSFCLVEGKWLLVSNSSLLL
eukprot:TRINITY_DN7560_c0_g7_i1.p1 TRINITY_DN7560_c0_g7~~TRINITY_DN7560_c0_g7_i1.p1  ORF type:complete len:125 (-),score=7.95 TRINITY_DN7560_c0_g7_i1:351-725(-)